MGEWEGKVREEGKAKWERWKEKKEGVEGRWREEETGQKGKKRKRWEKKEW